MSWQVCIAGDWPGRARQGSRDGQFGPTSLATQTQAAATAETCRDLASALSEVTKQVSAAVSVPITQLKDGRSGTARPPGSTSYAKREALVMNSSQGQDGTAQCEVTA
jgi:hypothetical protein